MKRVNVHGCTTIISVCRPFPEPMFHPFLGIHHVSPITPPIYTAHTSPHHSSHSPLMHPFNRRKRKSDAVEPDSSDSPAVKDSPTALAPRLPSTKRPRIDTLHATSRPFHHTSRTIYSPLRTPCDIEDIGIVVTSSDPGPSSGSLLRDRPNLPPVRKLPNTPTTPVLNPLQPDYSSPYIPPTTPLINRQTLRELDLDVIIRNPMLRMFSLLFSIPFYV